MNVNALCLCTSFEARSRWGMLVRQGPHTGGPELDDVGHLGIEAIDGISLDPLGHGDRRGFISDHQRFNRSRVEPIDGSFEVGRTAVFNAGNSAPAPTRRAYAP